MRARKNMASILRALSSIGQVRVADLLGISESTVSRMKDAEIERFSALLSALGLKVVSEDMTLMDPQYVRALQVLAKRGVENAEAPSGFGEVDG